MCPPLFLMTLEILWGFGGHDFREFYEEIVMCMFVFTKSKNLMIFSAFRCPFSDFFKGIHQLTADLLLRRSWRCRGHKIDQVSYFRSLYLFRFMFSFELSKTVWNQEVFSFNVTKLPLFSSSPIIRQVMPSCFPNADYHLELKEDRGKEPATRKWTIPIRESLKTARLFFFLLFEVGAHCNCTLFQSSITWKRIYFINGIAALDVSY